MSPLGASRTSDHVCSSAASGGTADFTCALIHVAPICEYTPWYLFRFLISLRDRRECWRPSESRHWRIDLPRGATIMSRGTAPHHADAHGGPMRAPLRLIVPALALTLAAPLAA